MCQTKCGAGFSLVVIDTMLAAFDIRDWNDPGETRRIMSALGSIGEKTGAVVLGVHHHGKDVTGEQPVPMPLLPPRTSSYRPLRTLKAMGWFQHDELPLPNFGTARPDGSANSTCALSRSG